MSWTGRIAGFVLAVVLLLTFVLAVVPGAGAQTPATTAATTAATTPATTPATASGATATPALPDPLSEAAVRDLLSRLSDTQVRELLLQELDRLTGDQQAGAPASLAARVESGLGALRTSYVRMLEQVPNLLDVPGFFFRQLIGERSPSILLLIAAGLTAVFAIGFLAEWGFRRLVAPLRKSVESAEPETAVSRLGWLLLRIGLELFGLVIFALGSIAAFFVLHQGHPPVRLTATTILDTILVVRGVILVSRFVLAPHAARLRLFNIASPDAKLLHRQVRQVAIAGGILLPIGDLLALLGLDPPLRELVEALNGWVFVALLIAAIWRVRAPVAHLIRGDVAAKPAEALPPADRVRNLIAGAWHVPMTAYVIAIALTVEVSTALGADELTFPAIASLLLVVLAPILDAILVGVSDQFWTARAAMNGAGATNYARLSRRCLHIMILLLTLLVFGELWGVSVFDVAGSGIAGKMLDSAVDIGVVLLLAYVSWEIVKSMIDRRLADEGEVPAGDHDAGGEGGGPGASRLRTLLPLLRTFLFGTIVVMAVMIILSSLGVNIGPLIAGAGVIGLAIGFGAQTLVRDIVSGVFFLVDDAFRLGEYIEVGATRGTVEKISIRSLRLRHHRGPLHTIPFGEVAQLTNHSRDWVIMKLQFRVPYDTDLAKVKKIFKQIGAEIAADPVMGPNLLQPFKSQGVLEVDDSALVVRGKFMTKPGEQFTIRREVFQRVQQKFEENGIHFARRQVSVYVPPSDEGSPPNREAVAQAAAAIATAEDAAGSSESKVEAR